MFESRLLIIAILLFAGLTINSKDSWDRWIYGAFTIVALGELTHFHQFTLGFGAGF